MIDPPYRDWQYLSQLKPDFTPLPPLDEGSPGVRCFILTPADDPLPEGGLEVIQRHYHSVVNWIEHVSDYRLRAYPEVVEVRLVNTVARISQVTRGSDLAYRSLTQMEAFSKWKPLSRPKEPEEVWLLMCRGNAQAVPCGILAEDEGRGHILWGMVNDPVISAWLNEAGLEFKRFNPVLGYPAFYTPNYASAILAHELLHALGAEHHPTGIMCVGELGEDWPNIPIDNFAKEGSTMEVLAKHPLARPKE